MLVAMATFVSGLVFGGIGASGVLRPTTDNPPSAQVTAQPTPPSSGTMCSTDSEGSVGSGWGPDRPTFHDDTYPANLTFNSTSTGAIGDERNFVAIRPASGEGLELWTDNQEVAPDGEYLVRVYARLDGPAVHVAKGTSVSMNVPTCTAHRIAVAAFLRSTDAFPVEIWDGAAFWSRKDFNLAVIPDSGFIYSNARPGPAGLAVSLRDLTMNRGIDLGSRALDGVFYPGYADDVYLTFKVRAQVAK